MTVDELKALVKNTLELKSEGQHLELKAAKKECPRKLYGTLSSFSNQKEGGIILLGIDETKGFELCGVDDIQTVQQQLTEQCNQMIPKVRPVFTVAVIDGKTVCSVEIPEMELHNRPCYYGGAGLPSGAYIRVGEADLKMTDYEIWNIEAFKAQIHSDLRVVDADISELVDEAEIDNYLVMQRRARPGFSRLDRETALKWLELYKDGKPTLASLMTFGLYPQAVFPQFAITAMVVPGTEIGDVSDKGARFTSNNRIEGTISEMASGAVAFCIRNMKTSVSINPKTGVRTDRNEYPIEALREAILNALIHRDYSEYTESMPIQIIFFADRLEVRSPGNLYGKMTVEQLGYDRCPLRNPSLATMNEFVTGTENRNSGIPTMRRAMKEHGLRPPVFENRRNEFVVTFYNEIVEADVDNKSHLNEFLKVPRSKKEISSFLGYESVSYAFRKYIEPMIKEGKIRLTDPDNPGSHHQKYYLA